MASSPSLPLISAESISEVHDARSNVSAITSYGLNFDATTSEDQADFQWKRRRITFDADISSCDYLKGLKSSFPTLQSPDYFMFPSLGELSTHVLKDPDYTSQVLNFTIGRSGYGSVKFFGKTDIRWLDLDKIVKFHRNEIVVYEDETIKPLIGQGLNKDAEVTLVLQLITTGCLESQFDNFVKKLRCVTESQGAQFISFDPKNCEWKFSVNHFSRFGLTEEEEEDIVMDDANAAQDPAEMNGSEISDDNEKLPMDFTETMLCHSLPAHLGLDPLKMKEMKMVIFPEDERDFEDSNESPKFQKPFTGRDYMRFPPKDSSKKISQKLNSPVVRKTPLALLEYNHGSLDSNSHGSILMSQPKKVTAVKPSKAEGFKLDLSRETPITVNHSHNIVDAGLFMGRSFRVGWGPNGILVHTGNLVGNTNSERVLSSVVNVERIAIDNVVRDENNKVRKELVEFAFDSPLNLHKEMNHEIEEVEVGSFKLKLQKVVCNRQMLSEICRGYIDIVERQLEVPGLSPSECLFLTHQVMVWELVKVLFSERGNIGTLRNLTDDNEEDMMQDMKEASLEFDLEALPLIRRAEFSCWLQESVYSHVQFEISSLNDSNYLEHIFLLMTGRQLDAAVQLASSKGDVRLACLLSQAGGSTVNRADVALQLDIWRRNGMDFSFIEKERTRLYELLAGNIIDAVHDVEIDWKRFLGLLMWYRLPPDTTLPVIFHSYQHLLNNGRAPNPVPVYVDGPNMALKCNTKERLDLTYFLMLLHANEDPEFGFLKTMLSAFSSTDDPLDYHMIWHQRAVLEAVGAISSNDLHILDMGLVSQLLCLGQCHWAIYVVLHMPFREDFPYLQAKVIGEILFQYCEIWSSQESQLEFIENLGVPRVWLHEAMAVFFSYHGDLPKALEHFIECRNWHKAHTIFTTSVAHGLFLSAKDSDIWKLATSMEDHKSEIENWEFGAGIYISFYSLRSSLQKSNDIMSELDSLERRNVACGEFLGRLNESLAVWGDSLPVEARVVYSKMAEEICCLLLSDIDEGSTRDAQLSCFDTVFTAPIREDLRASHLQDAVSLFTCFLSEIAS